MKHVNYLLKALVVVALSVIWFVPKTTLATGLEMTNCTCSCPATADQIIESTKFTNSSQEIDYSSLAIRLNELLPDPEGRDSDHEYIELYNIGSQPISLKNWVLTANSREFTLPDVSIRAGEYQNWLIAETKLTLSNNGSVINLIDPTGRIHDQASYSGPVPTNEAFARTDGQAWQWTVALTPGSANQFPPPDPPVTETPDSASDLPKSSAETDSDQSTEVRAAVPIMETLPNDDPEPTNQGEAPVSTLDPLTPLTQLPEMDAGEAVRIKGVVSLPLGIIGKTMFMIQGDNEAGGAVIRITSRERPTVAVGDRVVISGKMAATTTGWRINAHQDEIVISAGQPPKPLPLLLTEISTDHYGRWIQTEAIITSKTSKKILLTDSDGIAELEAWLVNAESLPGQTTDRVSIAGVIDARSDKTEIIILERSGLKIMPALMAEPDQSAEAATNTEADRDSVDLPVAANLAGALQKTIDAGSRAHRQPPAWPLALAGSGIAGAGAWVWLSRRRHVNSPIE